MQKLYEDLKDADGTHFQKVFTRIMKKKYGENFQSTKVYGNEGDKKVDGILNFNIGFAVYAPVDEYKEKYALQKIKSDYDGFVEAQQHGYWKEINRLIFVIKCYGGITPNVFNLIINLNNQSPNLNINVWNMDDIYNEIQAYIPPSIPFEELSSLSSKVTQLKESYIGLYKEFNNMNQNASSILEPGQEEYTRQLYNVFVFITNIDTEIYNIRHTYFKHFDNLKIGKKIDELIDLKPKFYQHIMGVYDGLNDIGNCKKHERRLKICAEILEKLNNN